MGVIQKQGIQNTIVTFIGILIGFVNIIIIQPRFLTPEEIGLTRMLFSFSSMVAVFLPLGIGNATVKFFPIYKDRAQKHHGYFGFMLIFPIVGFIITTSLLYIFREFFVSQYIKESKLFTDFFNYVIPLSFIIGLLTVLNIYCNSLFKTTFPLLLNDVVTRIFIMIVISIYYLKWISIDEFVTFFVCVFALQLLILIFYILYIDKPSLRINTKVLKTKSMTEIFNYAFLLSFAGIAATGLKLLDGIILGKFKPLFQVGIYSIVSFIPMIIEAPLNSLEKITNTKISDALATKNMDSIKEIYFRSSRYLLLIGGLFFLGINVNINSLLTFLPPEFSSGGNVVLILSLGSLINVAAGSNQSIIFSSDSYKFGAFMLILLVIIAFGLNMFLIPIYGQEGAALSTALGALIYCLIRYVFILKTYKLQPFNVKTIAVLLLIAACFFLNKLLPTLDKPVLDILFHSAVIGGSYIIAVYFLKIVPEFHHFIPGHKKE